MSCVTHLPLSSVPKAGSSLRRGRLPARLLSRQFESDPRRTLWDDQARLPRRPHSHQRQPHNPAPFEKRYVSVLFCEMRSTRALSFGWASSIEAIGNTQQPRSATWVTDRSAMSLHWRATSSSQTVFCWPLPRVDVMLLLVQAALCGRRLLLGVAENAANGQWRNGLPCTQTRTQTHIGRQTGSGDCDASYRGCLLTRSLHTPRVSRLFAHCALLAPASTQVGKKSRCWILPPGR